MGIFSRIGEIVNANISSMLDRAEDPAKMVRLMIHELEDTLTEVKSSAAEVIADRIRTERQLKACRKNEAEWAEKAELAVGKGRDDLARVALERKLSYARDGEAIAETLAHADEMVKQYQEDIARLEDKLNSARRRQKDLALKAKRAKNSLRLEEKIHKANRTAHDKFEEFANRIDRMEAETTLTNTERDYDREFAELAADGDVENELQKLKEKMAGK